MTLNERIANVLCDVWDPIASFFRNPYLAERLLAPFNRQLNKEQRRYIRPEKAKREPKAPPAAVGKLAGAAKVALLPALGIAAAAVVLFVPGTLGTPGVSILDVLIAAARKAPVVETISAADASGASISFTVKLNSDDTQAVVYAATVERHANEKNVAPAQYQQQAAKKPQTSSEPATETVKPIRVPPVYVCGEKKMLELSDYRHDERFGNCRHELMVDVSSNQGAIDWDRVAATEVKAAMVRIGYRGRSSGNVYEDPFYSQNLRGAIDHGLATGAYFYSQAITKKEAEDEADFLIDRLKQFDGIKLPVAIDFEYESMSVYGELSGRLYEAKLSREEATQVVEAFCTKVMEAGYTPMVYANEDMLTNSLNADRLEENNRVWIACYSTKNEYAGQYAFWQCTDSGVVAGINGYVCLDFRYTN